MTTTREWLGRQRASLLVAAGFVAALLVVVVLGTGGARTSTPLDPDNPDPDGGQAVARVLDDRGVEVTVVRGADALDETSVGAAGTTVLVTSTDQLGDSTIGRLLHRVGDARLVLAAPGPGTTEAFGVTDPPYSVRVPSPRAADCDDPRFAGLSLAVDRALEYPAAQGCFAGEHGSLVVEPRPGVVLLGADEMLSNDQVLRADNAAAALRLLGQGERLVWYVPSLDDLVADDGVSAASLLPRWIGPGLWLGTITVLALIAWRARRLGPLATEPLSVVVRAIETTRSRGRLYRKAGDRAHAAAALRGAARARIAGRVGLGASLGDPATLVRDVARRVGRPGEEVAALLDPDTAAPTTDHDLITLANELAALDREVRRT
jgi:hypothetical protein